MDRIEVWKRARAVFAGAVKTALILAWLGGAMLLSSWCSGCGGDQHAWIKPLTCTGARTAVRLFCGADDGSSGGLLDRFIGGHSGGEASPDDPESGGLGEEKGDRTPASTAITIPPGVPREVEWRARRAGQR